MVQGLVKAQKNKIAGGSVTSREMNVTLSLLFHEHDTGLTFDSISEKSSSQGNINTATRDSKFSHPFWGAEEQGFGFVCFLYLLWRFRHFTRWHLPP